MKHSNSGLSVGSVSNTFGSAVWQMAEIYLEMFCSFYKILRLILPVTVGSWSKAWTISNRLDAGIVGSNPTRGMNVYVCVYVYSMFLLSCVGRGLAMSWSLIQGVLPTVLDRETEVKREVSRMTHAPVGAKKGIKTNKKRLILWKRWIELMRQYNDQRRILTLVILSYVLITWRKIPKNISLLAAKSIAWRHVLFYT
jgi:hypothetical protein